MKYLNQVNEAENKITEFIYIKSDLNKLKI